MHAVVGFVFCGWGLIAQGPQASILASIFGVTGVPPTEAQALRSKGEKYRAYRATRVEVRAVAAEAARAWRVTDR